ncbi:hypothetical protein CDAR_472931 [Caerostris darwini]|uniref:Uncharacterized protein n=1 Tax=Caerostris darwini TaxID=1538125 RepID=A0AAV4V9X9_9ARAC|nr:hypothetical protein CDAR_472931 [Caerostris darwini]
MNAELLRERNWSENRKGIVLRFLRAKNCCEKETGEKTAEELCFGFSKLRPNYSHSLSLQGHMDPSGVVLSRIFRDPHLCFEYFGDSNSNK